MSTHQYILAEADRASDRGTERGRSRLRYVSYTHYSQEWTSQLHSHTCAELFFITGGRGDFLIREERFPVGVHDMVAVNAGVPHTETSQNGSPLEYIVLGVEGLETLTDLGGCALLHLLGEQEAVTTCLRQMAREIRERQPGCDEVCQKACLPSASSHLKNLISASSSIARDMSTVAPFTEAARESAAKRGLMLSAIP